jgi:hypothetical protein
MQADDPRHGEKLVERFCLHHAIDGGPDLRERIVDRDRGAEPDQLDGLAGQLREDPAAAGKDVSRSLERRWLLLREPPQDRVRRAGRRRSMKVTRR